MAEMNNYWQQMKEVEKSSTKYLIDNPFPGTAEEFNIGVQMGFVDPSEEVSRWLCNWMKAGIENA